MSLRIIILFLALAGSTRAATLLIEAESFADRGGWVVDQQWMDQMGSPYLLAHGLGNPVADATTSVNMPEPGSYRIRVRTKDWVARWKAPGTPGRFEVHVNGKSLPEPFGAQGAEWFWQDGGTVDLPAGEVALTLHDLTGFEGRCDAIVLSNEPDFNPPNRDPEMAAFRREHLGWGATPEAAGEYDLVVVGGGIAGTCASLSAARLGLQVALVQDRPVVGGNNSSEVRVWLQGARNKAPYPRVGDIVGELEQKRHAHYGPENTEELYEDERKMTLLRGQENLTLFMEHRANGIEMDGRRIRAVVAQHTISGKRVSLTGRWFVDSTGDGCLGALAKADYDMTVPGHMGRCNLWNVQDTGEPVAFPRCPWALDLADKPFPGRVKAPDGSKPDFRGIKALGGWYWESGFDHHPIERGEYIRDWNFRAMYGAWDALKNVDGMYPNHQLNWSAYVSGKRESRRLIGDVVLTKEDVLSLKEFPDGCVPTGWPIDVHVPDPRYVKGFEGDAFIAKANYDHYKTPLWIPYRCLYSRNIDNLFMAGRDISVTHEALGTVRVMRTGGCMGEVVGMAASLCKQHDTAPRGVYENHLGELKALMSKGAGKKPEPPQTLKDVGTNAALQAKISTSGDLDPEQHPPSRINDGQIDRLDNDARWLSAAGVPHGVEFKWTKPQTLIAARIVSGYGQGGSIIAPLDAFELQAHNGRDWELIPGTNTSGNLQSDWVSRFKPITTDRVRLWVTAVHTDTSRIWEVELYAPPGTPP